MASRVPTWRALSLGVLILAAFPAMGASTVEVRVRPGEQMGKLLFCLGHRRLWGPRGVVQRTVRLNGGRKVRRDGDLIFPLTKILLLVPKHLRSREDVDALARQCVDAPEAEDNIAAAAPAATAFPPLAGSPKGRSKKRSASNGKGREPIEDDRRPLGLLDDEQNEPWVSSDANTKPPEAPSKDAAETSVTRAPDAPAPAATPTPAAVTEAGSPPREGVGKPFRAGAALALHRISVNAAAGVDAYTQVGLAASLGVDFAVARQWFVSAELEALVLPLADGSGESVRPLRAALGFRVRLVDSAGTALYLLPSVQYLTLLGLSARSGYRDLWGPELALQLRRTFGRRAGLLEVAGALYASDTNFLSTSNRNLRACLGYASERSWSDARWTVRGCGCVRGFAFQNGTGSETAANLGVEFRW